METDLIKYTNKNNLKGEVWDRILEIENEEFDDLKFILNKKRNNFNVYKADIEGIKLLETIYNIKEDTSLTLEERRANVIIAMNMGLTITKARRKWICESFGKCTAEVEEYFKEYYLILNFIDSSAAPRNFKFIRKSLRKVIPAHLNFDMALENDTVLELHTNEKSYNVCEEMFTDDYDYISDDKCDELESILDIEVQDLDYEVDTELQIEEDYIEGVD